MTSYILKATSGKGCRVFATRGIKQGEDIFHVDLNGLQKYTLAELERAVEENPELDGDHAYYVGRGNIYSKTPQLRI